MLSTIQPTRFRPLRTLSSVTAAASAASSVADHSPPTAASTLPSPPRSQILSLRHSLISRHVTAVQLAESYLARIRHTDPVLHSFLHVSESQVLQEARLLDRRIEDGESLGPLAGVLVGVKDNICTADMPSTGGSRILREYRTAYDATAVRKVRDLGGIVVGKTNLDEFGMGSTTEGSGFQVKIDGDVVCASLILYFV